MNIATTGLELVSTGVSEFDDLTVERCTGTAYVLTVLATAPIQGGAGGCGNVWRRIHAYAGNGNSTGSGMLMTGIPGQDYCQNVFTGFSLIYGSSGSSYGLKMTIGDNNTFMEGLIMGADRQAVGTGVVFEPLEGPSNTGALNDNNFMNVAIIQGVSGTAGIKGGAWFFPYPTSDGEARPDLPNVHYVTHHGNRVTVSKAGPPADSDWFDHNPPDGTMVTDNLNNRFYVRVKGTWVSSPLQRPNSGVNVPVPASSSSLSISLSVPEPDANYGVIATPNWLTTQSVTGNSSTGFTLTFGAPAPAGATVTYQIVR